MAERERVTILHYNGDYDLIAQITGQPVQWVVPRGTVPPEPVPSHQRCLRVLDGQGP
jgi:hypothetical protein